MHVDGISDFKLGSFRLHAGLLHLVHQLLAHGTNPYPQTNVL
jgi:hypothetical protein